MHAPRVLSAKTVLVALFGAGLVASGVAVGVATHGGTNASASLSSSSASPSPGVGRHGFGPGGRFDMDGLNPMRFLGLMAKDTGLTPQQIVTDIRNGQTLDQIAGSKASQVKSDALAALKTRLDAAVSKGVFTAAQEQHLLADAQDALDQLFAAKLGAAGLGSMGMGHGFGFGGRHHGPPAASPSPGA